MASAIRVVHLGLHGSIRALLRPGPRCVLPIYARAALGPMVRYILAGLTLHVHVWVRILGPRYLPRRRSAIHRILCHTTHTLQTVSVITDQSVRILLLIQL